ncbi:hypothetical protein BKA69DRAFT_1127162 [Paraphysoderma sedebokerense]|nr:hypothetical protein BKA69DRAFT_1127162 [Paraphysoderma sedebokerense]
MLSSLTETFTSTFAPPANPNDPLISPVSPLLTLSNLLSSSVMFLRQLKIILLEIEKLLTWSNPTHSLFLMMVWCITCLYSYELYLYGPILALATVIGIKCEEKWHGNDDSLLKRLQCTLLTCAAPNSLRESVDDLLTIRSILLSFTSILTTPLFSFKSYLDNTPPRMLFGHLIFLVLFALPGWIISHKLEMLNPRWVLMMAGIVGVIWGAEWCRVFRWEIGRWLWGVKETLEGQVWERIVEVVDISDRGFRVKKLWRRSEIDGSGGTSDIQISGETEVTEKEE